MSLPNNRVWAHHGTSSRFLPSILANGLRHSTWPGNWLGRGGYFFENDPVRAAEWAETIVARKGGSPVVLEAVIDLEHCLDLTQLRYRRLTGQVGATFLAAMDPDQRLRLRQTWARRELDCQAIDFVIETVHKSGQPFSSVRAIFTEGEPILRTGALNSGINELDHIQICVVDPSAITQLGPVSP